MNKKIFLFILSISIFFAGGAHAATLYTLPESVNLAIGQEFNLDLKIDTNDSYINATQAKVSFPTDILTLLSVDKSNSIFDFWLDGPTISNDNGTMVFVGGTPKGLSGKSLQVLSMKFKTKIAGSSKVAISDAVITASDGKGTNVLSAVKGSAIAVNVSQITPTPAPPPVSGSEIKPPEQPEPQKIVRQAVPAQKLPQVPSLKLPLYPDQSRWYNYTKDFVVLWDVPADVTQVASQIDGSPNTKPQTAEKELVNGKRFAALGDGIWYVHVRFKNNVGWGDTAHYKIAIDTVAPLQFEVKMDNLISDNPTPEIRYDTKDNLSGVSYSLIYIDGKDPIKSTDQSIILPVLAPGKHKVIARVFDLAGNSIEDSVEFEILPLPAPSIDFFTKTIYSGEPVFISGKALPKVFVDLKIRDKQGRDALSRSVSSDESGNWTIFIKETFANGKYDIVLNVRDSRGAVSNPAKMGEFQVKEGPVISFMGIDFGWFEILLIVLSFGIGSGFFFFEKYISGRKTREAYKNITFRDVEKLKLLLEKDLNGLEKAINDEEKKFYLKKARETMSKFIESLGREIGNIK